MSVEERIRLLNEWHLAAMTTLWEEVKAHYDEGWSEPVFDRPWAQRWWDTRNDEGRPEGRPS